MIDRDEARRLVTALLDEAERNGGTPCVLVGDAVDYGDWWVQGYQSRAFVESGDVLSALAGNGPVVVPKDGSDPFHLSSTEPAETQMARLRRAEREDVERHPLNSDEARRHAEQSLSASTRADGIERVITRTVEAGGYWVFFFQGRDYIEKDDLRAMLAGNAPIVVPKDGSASFKLGIHEDIGGQLERLADGTYDAS